MESETADRLDRRQFLALSNTLLFSATVFSLSPLSISASEIEDLDFTILNTSRIRLLADVCRLLFPHASLEDVVYLGIVKDIEHDISRDEAKRNMLARGINTFNREADGDWFGLDTKQKIKVLKTLQKQDYFSYLHVRTIESLYRHPKVWKLTGYEGSSIEHGGYLHRGFDDIDWLDKI